MAEDRSWMYTGRRAMGDCSQEWMEKSTDFVDRAFARSNGRGVLCPCSRCSNTRPQMRATMIAHLCKYGFRAGYTVWVYHGESQRSRSDVLREAHRQGSSSMARYKKNLEKKKQRPVSDMEAYVEARRGDQEGTLCSQRATENLAAYTDAAKEIHGPDYDVMNSPLDATTVYKAGKGKKHGRFLMGAGYISTPTTLSEVRTTSTASTDEVNLQSRPRPSHGLQSQVSELQAQLRQEIEARQRLEQMLLQALGTGTRLNGPPPGEPLPNISAPGTAGSVASTANAEDAGANVEDHVNASIAERPPPELAK